MNLVSLRIADRINEILKAPQDSTHQIGIARVYGRPVLTHRISLAPGRVKSMPTPHPSRPDGETRALHAAGSERADDPSLARIGAFSDGVFAFAITLLVLTIRIPHPTDADATAGLLKMLTQQWRNYMAFVLSFMLGGINWTNHRVMFSKFARANHTLVWLNLLYLMLGVAFMPIPTAILGDWMGNPQNQVVAAVFYGAAATVGGVVFNVLWWYGAYAAKLTSPGLTARERRTHTLAWGPAPLVVAALTVVAFVNPALAVAGYLATVVFYVLPAPGLVALLQRRGRTRAGPPN